MGQTLGDMDIHLLYIVFFFCNAIFYDLITESAVVKSC